MGPWIVALALLGTSADAPSLGWLEGRWTGEKDGVRSSEEWREVAPGALLGVHADVKDGRLAAWEFLRIGTTAEGMFYFAIPRSAPPTAFRLVERSERRVVFENPKHDFPQRILYWLDASGALHARIEGPQAGQTLSEEWVWTRTSGR